MSDEPVPGTTPDNTPAPAPTASWRDSLPDDIKASPTLTKFETVEGLTKSYINLEKMLGADKVAIPKEGDEEGWNRAYKALGAPERPDEYGFKQPDKIPDGMVYNPDLDKNLADIFHGAKLNKQQGAIVRQKLIDMVGQGTVEGLDAQKKAEAAKQLEIQKGMESLKGEWGEAFEQRGQVAGAAIKKFLSDETVAAMDAAGLANNPSVIRDMYKLGTALAGEKELIGSSNGAQSPADLDASIADFREKHAGALFDKSHADHDQRVREFSALFARRFPEQKQ